MTNERIVKAMNKSLGVRFDERQDRLLEAARELEDRAASLRESAHTCLQRMYDLGEYIYKGIALIGPQETKRISAGATIQSPADDINRVAEIYKEKKKGTHSWGVDFLVEGGDDDEHSQLGRRDNITKREALEAAKRWVALAVYSE